MDPLNPKILLTFDVEDWFQVENFKKCIPFSSWSSYELRVEKNVHRILGLLDSIKLNNPTNLKNVSRESAGRKGLIHNSKPATRNNGFGLAPSEEASPRAMPYALCDSPKATFFVLGWIAGRLPRLVREIQARGHEVASHGYDHVLCREQSAKDLKNDLLRSKKLLEDIIGIGIDGYRAPGFSVNRDILSLIEETGYLYDSSYNSFRLNKRYGYIDLREDTDNGILHKVSDSFYEFPISNLRIGGKVLPWGGGGYFRLMPTQVFRRGIQAILNKKGAYLFYLHPWEVDPNQPRMSSVSKSLRFRHYVNIHKTSSKLSMLLNSFKQYRFSTCIQYIIDETQETQQTQQTQ